MPGFVALTTVGVPLALVILFHRAGHGLSARRYGVGKDKGRYNREHIRMLTFGKQAWFWLSGALANLVVGLPGLLLLVCMASVLPGGDEGLILLKFSPLLIWNATPQEILAGIGQIDQVIAQYGVMGVFSLFILGGLLFVLFSFAAGMIALIPLPPFDGGRLLFTAIAWRNGVRWYQYEQVTAVIVRIVIVAIVTIWMVKGVV